MIIWFIAGILGGEVCLDKGHLLPLFLVSMLSVLGIVAILYQYKTAGLYFVFFMLGMACVIKHPVVQEQKYFIKNQMITLEGNVVRISESTFNSTLTIDDVTIKNNDTTKAIRSKVNIRVSKQSKIRLYDTIKVTGNGLASAQKMNPSDMDYKRYLTSQGIAATIEGVKCEQLWSNPLNKQLITNSVDRQIERLFNNKDKGIMKTLLIGNDDDIPDDIYEIYSRTGIGHVLSISGFHIALLISVLYILLSYSGISYTPKYISICSMIWLYTFLTGASTSTMRACIMSTLIISARCIWEEEDVLTNLALAAWIILVFNPFQLYQAGFQLSFIAVGSLCMSTKIIEKLEQTVSRKYLKIMHIIIPWICVTLATYPILAVHFYEVPLICTLLNIILIPLFSVIIVLGWGSLAVSIVSMNGAMLIAKVIIFLLNTIAAVSEKMLHMPLGTLCVGKPNLLEVIVYSCLISIVFFCIIGYIKKEKCIYIMAFIIGIFMFYSGLSPKTLGITYLYVGQGDGIVMATPHNKLILIDGGNFGKGKTVQKYIKYKGTKTVAAVILSHSHADHIGGIIELLDTDIKIQNIFVSRSDQSLLMNDLIKKCLDKKVNLYKVGYLDQFNVDGVTVTYLSPKDEITDTDANNNSLGCMIQYKKFSALFTGDMDEAEERQMSQTLKPITVLKVSHHGSNTATAEETLLKIKPHYAIISCGINNRYNHPHQNTLNTLERYPIDILRTDTQGAVEVNTDGQNVSVCTQIKGESQHAK